MDSIDQLTRIFERFPGIGPRQAQRFVQFLLRTSPATRRELAQAISQLGGSVHECGQCFRYFAGDVKLCDICANPERDAGSLAIVATDADLAALERSHDYRGLYFVVGGTISLGSEKSHNLRIDKLLASMPKRLKNGLKEIILAFPANPEGDATADRIRHELVRGLPSYRQLKVTSLGRGLSTGSELEYADPETLKSALESRR